MHTYYKRKLFASAVTAALVLSSLLLMSGVQAEAADDLEVSDLYEPPGTPPPRVDIPYDIVVGWKNSGDTNSYDATVRLYSDCDQSSLADESDTITMGPGESDTVTLSVTFTETGEQCYSATIYYDSTDYGEFENYLMVEPTTGDADLWISFDMDQTQAAQGEEISVIFEYGNDGEVTTLNPVTFMGYFDHVDDEPTDSIDPSPLTFDFLSPPPDDAPPEPERMEWTFTVPSDIDDGMHKFTIIIDSENNNTEEDPDPDNNEDVWEICIGDCSEPDLQVWDNGIDSIRCEPIDPIAGSTVTFRYSVENIGEGDAEPPGPFDEGGDLVMHLEVMKCPEGDCTDQPEEAWLYVNQSNELRTPISSGEIFNSDSVLAINWSTDSNDAGLWNVRIYVDGENVVEETDETNNALDWFKVYDEYFELREQRPDLIVAAINEGPGRVFQDDPRTIQVALTQSELGDTMADDVDVFIKIHDPNLDSTDWIKIDESKTVGFTPDTTLYEYEWTPTLLGVYEFEAWADKEDTVLEWDETNNQYDGDKYVEVFEKLPDLQVASVSVSPFNDDGYGMVGVSSEITATIVNLGVRDMTSSEGSKLEVSFYVAAPFAAELATINVDKALAIDESVEVSIPFKFASNSQYRLVVKVDEAKLIEEDEEWNNENYKNIYAVSSMDAYVSNLSVVVNDGLAGKDHPITFELGMANLPDEGDYRLHFNITLRAGFGFGETMALNFENTTGSYPLGSGYQVSGPYAFIDFNASYSHQTVEIDWIPDPGYSRDYTVTVDESSAINVDPSNDEAMFNISIEKLTTNLVVESIKVTDSDGSATIKVTVGYPQGEQSELDVNIGLEVYKASDYTDGGAPIDVLTMKTITQLLKGDSRPISFTWAIRNTEGSYIFVAIVDPDNEIREVNEIDNAYPSQEVTFGSTTNTGPEEEEEGGLLDRLLPAPSIISAIALLGAVALTRRRS